MGSLHVITGCMFSGKTEELLRQLRRASVGGRTILLIRPLADTRTDTAVATSRSGTSYECTSVATSQDVLAAVAKSPCELVAIGSRRRCSVRSSRMSPTSSPRTATK